jgi:hypothetical protein
MTQNAINTGSRIMQYVFASSNAVVTPGSTMPEGSIPQQTQGAEIITCSITPKFSTSTLHIVFTGQVATLNEGCIALFQDAGADAIVCTFVRGSESFDGILRYVVTSGTTSSTTFKIRLGNNNNSQQLRNNSDLTGNRLMGGVMTTLLSITEYI